jgi:hypothetical protein
VDIAILPRATRTSRVGNVCNVDEDNTGSAAGISWNSAYGIDEIRLVVRNDVVSSADG